MKKKEEHAVSLKLSVFICFAYVSYELKSTRQKGNMNYKRSFFCRSDQFFSAINRGKISLLTSEKVKIKM